MLLKRIAVEILIILGLKNVKVYSDPEMTLPVSSIHQGEVRQGESTTITLYARNEGLIGTDVQLTATGDLSWGSVVIDPPGVLHLDPSEAIGFEVTATVNPDTTPTTVNFNLDFTDGNP